MSCENICQVLPAFLGGELTTVRADEVRTHLLECAGCRKQREELEQSWAKLGVLSEIQLSSDFEARFWAKVRREEEKMIRWSVVPSWLFPMRATALFTLVAMAWAAGLAGGIFAYQNNQREQVDNPTAVAALSSALPINSIEEVYLGRTVSLAQEGR